MQITLPPKLEAMVQRDLATGRYATVEAYIAEAVELLHERDTGKASPSMRSEGSCASQWPRPSAASF